MKRIIITIGFSFFIVCVVAQNKRLLWHDKDSNGKYGIIDTAKNIVVDYQYDEIKLLRSSNIGRNYFFRTKLNGKYGIITKFGKEVITPQYDEITLRSQAADWIETKLNDKYGFADFIWSEELKKHGDIKEIFQPKYDRTIYSAGESFPSGYIQVQLNNKWGLVNEKSGKEITGMKYDKVYDFFFYQGFKWTKVKLNTKFGLIDLTGKEVLPCKYDEVISIESEGSYKDKIKVKLGDREFYIDKKGTEVK